MKKIYLAVIIALLPVWEVIAQENSVDEGKGNWTDGSTWVSWTPVTSGISTAITINGWVSAPSLDFGNGPDIEIADRDTLVIDGDLTMGQNNIINIGNGAVLVVTGDYTTTSTHVISNSGTIIVIGQTTLNGTGNTVFNNDSLYLLGGNNLSSGVSVKDTDDLNNDNPDLVNLLDSIYGTTLPVELLYFSAIANNNQVVLDWKTATETNNDYFIVERAAADRQFTEVAQVPGQGTVSFPVAYQLEDKNPPPGQLYYRLQQIDLDGSQHYHPAISVHFTNSPSVLVFPNPSSDGQFECRISEVIERAEYVDVAGILHQGQVMYANGVVMISPVKALKKGFYVVRLLTKKRIHLSNILIR